MKKLLMLLVLIVTACGPLDIEPSTDVDQEDEGGIESREDALWCFGFPWGAMAFPSNQGSWKGQAAGQWMYPLFGYLGDSCPAKGTEITYVLAGNIAGEFTRAELTHDKSHAWFLVLTRQRTTPR